MGLPKLQMMGKVKPFRIKWKAELLQGAIMASWLDTTSGGGFQPPAGITQP